jgi:hypothetical protein
MSTDESEIPVGEESSGKLSGLENGTIDTGSEINGGSIDTSNTDDSKSVEQSSQASPSTPEESIQDESALVVPARTRRKHHDEGMCAEWTFIDMFYDIVMLLVPFIDEVALNFHFLVCHVLEMLTSLFPFLLDFAIHVCINHIQMKRVRSGKAIASMFLYCLGQVDRFTLVMVMRPIKVV